MLHNFFIHILCLICLLTENPMLIFEHFRNYLFQTSLEPTVWMVSLQFSLQGINTHKWEFSFCHTKNGNTLFLGLQTLWLFHDYLHIPRLSRPGKFRLSILQLSRKDGNPWFTHLQTVIHPSNNCSRHRATTGTLIETSALSLSQTALRLHKTESVSRV